MTYIKQVKIGDFLKERKYRYKPHEARKLNLQRVEKIDFSGNIFLSDKKTNTDMILVKSGDLLISGINVEKGAVSVYEGRSDVLATIHYSAYEFDSDQIDIEYLKWFLKSKTFRNLLLEIVASGIKTELRAKHLLPLEIFLPDIDSQKRIVKSITNKVNKLSLLAEQNKEQLSFTKNLRESILQEAVQGKLVPQDPNDEQVSELLNKVKAEKEKIIKEGKIKKERSFSYNSEKQMQFKTPKGWEFLSLNQLGYFTGGGTPSMSNSSYWNGDIPWISPKDMNNEKIEDSEMQITSLGLDNSSAKLIPLGSVLIVSRSGILKRKIPVAVNKVKCTVNQDIKVLVPYIKEMNEYLVILIKGFESIILKDLVKQGMTVQSLKYQEFENYKFPIPPLGEQKRILEKADRSMKLCDELEEKIKESQENAAHLMQVVLQEAFNNDLQKADEE